MNYSADTLDGVKSRDRQDARHRGPGRHARRVHARCSAACPSSTRMAVVELAVALEEREFDFEIDDEDFTGEVFETIGTLAEFVEENKS